MKKRNNLCYLSFYSKKEKQGFLNDLENMQTKAEALGPHSPLGPQTIDNIRPYSDEMLDHTFFSLNLYEYPERWQSKFYRRINTDQLQFYTKIYTS